MIDTNVSSSSLTTSSRPRGPRPRWLPVGIIAAALVLAACGDDDQPTASEDSPGEDESRSAASEDSPGDEPGGTSEEGEDEAQGTVVSEGPVTVTFPPGFPPPDRQEEDMIVPGVGPLELTGHISFLAAEERMAGIAYGEFDMFAGRSPDVVLSDAVRNAVEDESKTLISEEAFERNGHPVHEVLTSEESGYVRSRYHLVDSHFVQMLFIASEQAAVSGSEADAFFDSLDLEVDSDAP